MKRHLSSVLIILLAAVPVQGSGLLVHADGGSISAVASDDLRGLWVSCQLEGDSRQFVSALPDSGAVVFEIPAADTLAGREFTCSVWGKRVERCGCEQCLAWGYHLEGRLAACSSRAPTTAITEAVERCLPGRGRVRLGRGWYALHRTTLKELSEFFRAEGTLIFPTLGPTGLQWHEGVGPCRGEGVPYFLRCVSEGIREPTLLMGCQILFGDEAYVNCVTDE